MPPTDDNKQTRKGQEKAKSPDHTGALSPKQNGGIMDKFKGRREMPQAFRKLSQYNHSELRKIKFNAIKQADEAFLLIRRTLAGLPILPTDGQSFIVPEESIEVLKKLRLQFETCSARMMSDLSLEERSEIRRA